MNIWKIFKDCVAEYFRPLLFLRAFSKEQARPLESFLVHCYVAEAQRMQAQIADLAQQLGDANHCVTESVATIIKQHDELIAKQQQINSCGGRLQKHAKQIKQLKEEVAAKQARIDALMLQYESGEMTTGQMAERAAHQKAVEVPK